MHLAATTVAAEWDDFAAKTFPPGCPQVQIDDMRAAFYIGFSACMQILQLMRELPRELRVDHIEALRRELIAFGEQAKDAR